MPGVPAFISPQHEVEATQDGPMVRLAGGSRMYKYDVRIIGGARTIRLRVHYKPDVQVGRWRWGPNDGDMRDCGNARVRSACLNAS
jgi:hypothetical protein